MGWPLVDARPQASIYTPPSCIRFLIERGIDHERILDREVPEHVERRALGLALPIIYRLEPLRGYNPIDIHRYKEYIQFISDRDEPVPSGNGIPNFPMVNKSLLDLLAVRYLVQPSDLPAMAGEPADVAQDPRWQAIAVDLRPRLTCSSPGGDNNCRRSRCTRIGTRFPKPSWFPGPNRFLSGVACCPRSSKPTCARSRFLRTLSRRAVSQTPRGGSGCETISTYEPNHVVVEVDCDSPGYLVLSDPWYPGWSCALDEYPTRLYRANYAFRAAAVPAGKHTVRFDFDPISYRRGRVISGTSLAAVAVLGLAAISHPYNSESANSVSLGL